MVPVHARRFSLFGNIVRMPDETDAKKILTAPPRRTVGDHQDALVLRGWRLSSRTWNIFLLDVPRINSQHMEDACSVMLDRLLGTLFLSVSRTMHCFCLTLGTSSTISTPRPTSTPGAFEDFLHLTRCINFEYLLTVSTVGLQQTEIK